MRIILSILSLSVHCGVLLSDSAGADVSDGYDASLKARVERLEAELAEYRRTQAISSNADEKSAESEADPYGITGEDLQRSDAESRECPPGFQLQDTQGMLADSPYPTLFWSGFVQVDTGWISQDEASKVAIGPIDSQTGLRRVRLRVDGDVRDNTAYVIDLDFAASGHPSFRDAKLVFHGIPALQNLQIGLFKQPFSMDGETSSREFVFMERQLPFAFDPFRQTGIGAYGTAADERVTWAASVYGYPTDSFGVTRGGGTGNSFGGRVTLLPVYEDEGERLVHVGFAYHFGNPANNIVRYSIEPGFFVTEGTESGTSGVPRIVDTGNIPTESFNLFNVQLAGKYGRFSIQSEASFSVVNQENNPTVSFSGVSVSSAYVLTGEVRPYDRSRGVFHDVHPRQPFQLGDGGGAWEVTAGWSYIDLNDENISGGRANQVVLGLTWYLGPNAKLMLNMIPAFVNTPGVGNSKVLVTALRGQVEF